MCKVCNCVWNVSEQISIFCKPKMQVVFLVLATFWKNLNELKGFCWSASFLGTQKQNKGDWCVTYFVVSLLSLQQDRVLLQQRRAWWDPESHFRQWSSEENLPRELPQGKKSFIWAGLTAKDDRTLETEVTNLQAAFIMQKRCWDCRLNRQEGC